MAITWSERLKRVFGIDIETCRACGGAVRIMPTALASFAGQALACIRLQGSRRQGDAGSQSREDPVQGEIDDYRVPLMTDDELPDWRKR